MKIIHYLLACILSTLLVISMNSCSKDNDEIIEQPIGVVSINGIDRKITDAGLVLSGDYTVVQLVIEDPDNVNNKLNVELQFPNSLTEDWYSLAPSTPSWRIQLHNTNGTSIGGILDGDVLIKKLGQLGKDNKREYRVAFEMFLTNGTKLMADVQAKFKNSLLWVGGR